MAKLRITRRAGADIESIQARGLEQFGAEVTREFMHGFDRIFMRLETYPLAGVAAPHFGRAVRSCLHLPFRVLYRFEGGEVSVLRVMHCARQVQQIDDTGRDR